MQFIHGLKSLRVLQIYELRTALSSAAIMAESRSFIVDTVSQHPELKLEYIVLDCAVHRLVRRDPNKKLKKEKGKEPCPLTIQQLVNGYDGPNAWMEGLTTGLKLRREIPGYDNSDNEELRVLGGWKGLKIQTIEDNRSHVKDVRIFEREVAFSRL